MIVRIEVDDRYRPELAELGQDFGVTVDCLPHDSGGLGSGDEWVPTSPADRRSSTSTGTDPTRTTRPQDTQGDGMGLIALTDRAPGTRVVG